MATPLGGVVVCNPLAVWGFVSVGAGNVRVCESTPLGRARRPSEGFWSWRRHRSSTSERTWTGGWRMSVCRCSCHTAGWRGVRRCRRPARVLKIRVTFSILMSPRCHQVAEILKAVSPLLWPAAGTAIAGALLGSPKSDGQRMLSMSKVSVPDQRTYGVTGGRAKSVGR